jgi:cell wall-associated NlpC family hydrolase
MTQDVVNIGRSWLNTNFHYAGRIKKNKTNNGGVDCIGLIIKIGEEIESKYFGKNIIYYDYLNYSRYPNHGEMKRFLDKFFISIGQNDLIVGDLIYFNFKNNLEHIAVYMPNNCILHCSAGSKKVIEEKLTHFWTEKIIGFYRYSH